VVTVSLQHTFKAVGALAAGGRAAKVCG